MTRVASRSMMVVLGVLALPAGAAWLVTLWKAFSFGGLALSLGWIVVIFAAYVAAQLPGHIAKFGAAVVIVAAIEMRIVSVDLVEAGRLGADAMNYANLAHAVLDGRGLITDDWRYGQGLRAYFPPLYPLALSGWWYLFGDSATSTLVMNTVIAAASAWTVRDIAIRLRRPRAGMLAALLFFAWPSFALAAALPNKEGLTILIVLLFLRALVIWRGDPAWRYAAAIGLLWAAMAMTQASLALFPPLIGLILIPHHGWRATLSLGLRASPFFIAGMAPWWLRNAIVFGQFVPFTTAAGFLVNVALDKYQLPIPPEVFAIPEPDRSGYMAQLAFARIASMPLAFLESVTIAFGRGFGYEEATIASYRHSTPPIDPAWRALLTPPLQFAWAALLADATWACWKARNTNGRDMPIAMLFAAFVAICAVGMWFEFGERHRLLLTPLLLLVAARAYPPLRLDADRS